jgi:hypothetical protein
MEQLEASLLVVNAAASFLAARRVCGAPMIGRATPRHQLIRRLGSLQHFASRPASQFLGRSLSCIHQPQQHRGIEMVTTPHHH